MHLRWRTSISTNEIGANPYTQLKTLDFNMLMIYHETQTTNPSLQGPCQMQMIQELSPLGRRGLHSSTSTLTFIC